jgi:hypothetical protein
VEKAESKDTAPKRFRPLSIHIERCDTEDIERVDRIKCIIDVPVLLEQVGDEAGSPPELRLR